MAGCWKVGNPVFNLFNARTEGDSPPSSCWLNDKRGGERNLPSAGIREKTIQCGRGYTEFYIYGKSDTDPPAKRNKREKVSAPKQQNLNDKNARRHFFRLAHGNFDKNDYHLTLSYDDENLPGTFEEAERDAGNMIDRIKRLGKKLGVPPPKYLYLTECYDKNGKPCRIHHHILISTRLSRDQLESLWRKKGMRKGEQIGFANADRIRAKNNGIERLARYITKYPERADDVEDEFELKDLHQRPRGKRRWHQSANLIIPYATYADSKYRPREFREMLENFRDREFWLGLYPGYEFVGCNREKSDISGWTICLKMQRMAC